MCRCISPTVSTSIIIHLLILTICLCIDRKHKKLVVDLVKVVIKSGKKNTSREKLRALVLLDKCLMQAENNAEFVTYVQKKVMERLTIMGAHCPKNMSISDAQNLHHRGAHIFLTDEPDTSHASQFLIQLLIFLKSWATQFPKEGQNQSTFDKSYQDLKAKGIPFADKPKAVSQRKVEIARQREA